MTIHPKHNFWQRPHFLLGEQRHPLSPPYNHSSAVTGLTDGFADEEAGAAQQAPQGQKGGTHPRQGVVPVTAGIPPAVPIKQQSGPTGVATGNTLVDDGPDQVFAGCLGDEEHPDIDS